MLSNFLVNTSPEQLLSLAALRKLEATHGTKCHSRCTQIRSVPQLGASTRSGAIFYLLRVFEWKALPAGVVAELLQATAVAAPAYILRKLASLQLCVRFDSGCCALPLTRFSAPESLPAVEARCLCIAVPNGC